jgi:hypothetical protein
VFAPFEITLGGSCFRQWKAFANDDLKLVFGNELENIVELLEIRGLRFQIIGYRKSGGFASVGQRWR